MNKEQAIHDFWSRFGIAVYDQNSVPDDVELPYLTYELSVDSFGNTLYLMANLWYRSTSWSEVTKKEQEIADFITRGGRMVSYDSGAMWIQRSSPWAQRLNDPNDDMMRRIVLNVTIEFLS